MSDIQKTQPLLDELKEFFGTLDGLDFAELEWEGQPYGIKVVRRQASGHTAPPASAEAIPLTSVTSPVVGRFHFLEQVQIGTAVAHGQKLGYVEAVNIKHHIEAPAAGHLADILVDEEAPVDFGQVLFRLKEESVP